MCNGKKTGATCKVTPYVAGSRCTVPSSAAEPFSLSMDCGSWGGNSIDDNVHWKHFLNITKVVREIPANEPTVDSIFDHYWDTVGK